MPVFTRSILIPAPPEALYRFHENPHNLRLISPPGLRILDIRAAETARPGADFTIAVRQGPFTLRWTGRWETTAPPGLLVDTGVRCPFARWRHHHIFEPHADGTVLTDRVEFSLPWFRGGPIGDWFALHFVFPRMFAARHAATRAAFAPSNP
ncbi:MAG: SRPBCC family protein [Chthoniobacterales bacterium]